MSAPCFTFDLELGLPELPIFQLSLPDIAIPLPNLNVGALAVVPCCQFAFNINITLPTLGLPLSALLTGLNATIYSIETAYNAAAASFGLSLGVAVPTCNQIQNSI